jgi:hypothetical protein
MIDEDRGGQVVCIFSAGLASSFGHDVSLQDLALQLLGS